MIKTSLGLRRGMIMTSLGCRRGMMITSLGCLWGIYIMGCFDIASFNFKWTILVTHKTSTITLLHVPSGVANLCWSKIWQQHKQVRKMILFIQTRVVQQENLLVKQVYNKIVKKKHKKSTKKKTRCHSPKSWRQAPKAPCAKVRCCLGQVLQPDLANWPVPSPATKRPKMRYLGRKWRVRELR